jgi:hypothetical protein
MAALQAPHPTKKKRIIFCQRLGNISPNEINLKLKDKTGQALLRRQRSGGSWFKAS